MQPGQVCSVTEYIDVTIAISERSKSEESEAVTESGIRCGPAADHLALLEELECSEENIAFVEQTDDAFLARKNRRIHSEPDILQKHIEQNSSCVLG